MNLDLTYLVWRNSHSCLRKMGCTMGICRETVNGNVEHERIDVSVKPSTPSPHARIAG